MPQSSLFSKSDAADDMPAAAFAPHARVGRKTQSLINQAPSGLSPAVLAEPGASAPSGSGHRLTSPAEKNVGEPICRYSRSRSIARESHPQGVEHYGVPLKKGDLLLSETAQSRSLPCPSSRSRLHLLVIPPLSRYRVGVLPIVLSLLLACGLFSTPLSGMV